MNSIPASTWSMLSLVSLVLSLGLCYLAYDTQNTISIVVKPKLSTYEEWIEGRKKDRWSVDDQRRWAADLKFANPDLVIPMMEHKELTPSH